MRTFYLRYYDAAAADVVDVSDKNDNGNSISLKTVHSV